MTAHREERYHTDLSLPQLGLLVPFDALLTSRFVLVVSRTFTGEALESTSDKEQSTGESQSHSEGSEVHLTILAYPEVMRDPRVVKAVLLDLDGTLLDTGASDILNHFPTQSC